MPLTGLSSLVRQEVELRDWRNGSAVKSGRAFLAENPRSVPSTHRKVIHSHLYLQRAPILLISVGISIHVHVLPSKHIIKNKINVKNLGSGVDSLPIRGIKLIRDAHRAEDAAKGRKSRS